MALTLSRMGPPIMFTSLALRRMLLLTLGPLLAFAGDAPGSAAESPYSGHGVQSVSPAQLASFAPTALDPGNAGPD